MEKLETLSEFIFRVRNEYVLKVLAACGEDIAVACKILNISQATFYRIKPKPTAKSERAAGVYIIHDGTSGAYKIGWSNQVLLRERTLQAQQPNLKLVKVYQGATQRDEAALHRFFKSKRLRGEWFKLDSRDVEQLEVYMNV